MPEGRLRCPLQAPECSSYADRDGQGSSITRVAQPAGCSIENCLQEMADEPEQATAQTKSWTDDGLTKGRFFASQRVL